MELDRFGWPSGPTLNVQSLPTDYQEPPQQDLDAVLDGLHEYQRRLFANRRHGVLLVVQGLDAAGKDSLIRTLARAMDPAAFRVHGFSRPLGEEVDHDFLWRVWRHLPARGEVESWLARDAYLSLVNETLTATHTLHAPWHLIPNDNKQHARAAVAQLLLSTLKELAPEYPQENPQCIEHYRGVLTQQND